MDKGLWSFLVETFEFSDKQLAAIDYQIPMTQEIYDSILDCCMELGASVDGLFYRLLIEYPDFMTAYGSRIEKELNEKYAGVELPESSPEELKAGWEALCARIRKEYGENAI
ncbi:hypothetical protein Lac2_23300 [Claveliimonas bilis]|uniref:hypothetical protein n=1 Tax=Claveliimonas bilis TaxID=3028070 RepID=UPI002930175E|nr:hypothetical protein [Claveliimonas bilis]BDZ84196.1 hypothetical protein Lac2_23300 [Claveliimonas bilis]